jgi:hypothetical protein
MAHNQERGTHIKRHHAIKKGSISLFDASTGDRRCVIHNHIDMPPPGQCGINKGGTALRFTQINIDIRGALWGIGAQRMGTINLEPTKDDVRTFIQKLACRCRTNPACCSTYQNDLLFKSSLHVVLLD